MSIEKMYDDIKEILSNGLSPQKSSLVSKLVEQYKWTDKNTRNYFFGELEKSGKIIVDSVSGTVNIPSLEINIDKIYKDVYEIIKSGIKRKSLISQALIDKYGWNIKEVRERHLKLLEESDKIYLYDDEKSNLCFDITEDIIIDDEALLNNFFSLEEIVKKHNKFLLILIALQMSHSLASLNDSSFQLIDISPGCFYVKKLEYNIELKMVGDIKKTTNFDENIAFCLNFCKKYGILSPDQNFKSNREIYKELHNKFLF